MLSHIKQNETVIVPVSLHADIFEIKRSSTEILRYLQENYYEQYKSFLSEVAENSLNGEIILIVVDTLHRYSPHLRIKQNLSEQKSEKFAALIGDCWEKFLYSIISLPEFKNLNLVIKIQHWNKPTSSFSITDDRLLESFNQAVNQYVGSRNFGTEHQFAKNLCEQYVLEECAVLLEWMKSYTSFSIIYLGTPNQAISFLCKLYGIQIQENLITCMVKNVNEEKSFSLGELQDPYGVLVTTCNRDFHLYDRNYQTLGTLIKLYSQRLRPLLTEKQFVSTLDKVDLAKIHVKIGIFKEALAGFAVVKLTSKISHSYYRSALTDLSEALKFFKEDPSPRFNYSKTAAENELDIAINYFTVFSFWRLCVSKYLETIQSMFNINQLQDVKKQVQRRIIEINKSPIKKYVDDPHTKRLRAEFLLLQLLRCTTKNGNTFDRDFKEAKHLLTHEVHLKKEWIQSYYCFGLCLLFLITTLRHFELGDWQSMKKNLDEGKEATNKLIKFYNAFGWNQSQNSDYRMAQGFQNAFSHLESKLAETNVTSQNEIQFFYHV